MNESLAPATSEQPVLSPSHQPTELSDFIPHHSDQTPRWWAVFQQPTFRWGLTAVVVSALLFAGYDFYVARNGTPNHFTLFVVHYSIALVYALMLWMYDEFQLAFVQPKQGRSARLLLLVLALISAYALNRDMPVFQESVPWLKGVLILAGLLMMSVAWLDALPVRGQQALVFGLALVWCLFVYQSLYVGFYYPFGFLGLILLGIGGHIFIPVLIAIAIGRVLWRSWKAHEHRRVAIVAGFFVPLAVTIWFVYQWMQVDTRIRYEANAINARQDDELPAWVLLAQNLPNDWITERYLKTGSIYTQAGESSNQLFGNQQELKRHDPLVFIATVAKKPTASWNADLGKLLATLYTSRHEHEERLWSGTHLRTTNLLTQARIYPEYRLAYTEKTLHVENSGSWQPCIPFICPKVRSLRRCRCGSTGGRKKES